MAEFNFNISLSILNHLGRNLYRNFITVIGEAISNSWDADAKNVWITIDRDRNFFVIKDDGKGMDEEDFQEKFLRIGYSKRKDGDVTTDSGRPYIGRKGIGKLALLSCAKRISIYTKTIEGEYIGGVIDNTGLDDAIIHDMSPDQYSLEPINEDLLAPFIGDNESGTIIFFEELNEGIRSRVEQIRKLIALSFKFSLLDPAFTIYVNGDPITVDELSDLANTTQFLWKINDPNDPYVDNKLIGNNSLKRNKDLEAPDGINGFIASVLLPSNLKIRGADENVSIDLYVNGRLRERNILKHIPQARLVESYIYGQIHYNELDDGAGADRFTSSREGVVSDDPLFKELLVEIGKLLREHIIDDWDKWRIELRQDGDGENPRINKKERKSRELFNAISVDYTPPQGSPNGDEVNAWIDGLSNDAQFNFASYGECFVSENLLRKFIQKKSIPLSQTAHNEVHDPQRGFRAKEIRNKQDGNIAFEIRQNPNDLSYLEMKSLAFLSATIVADQQERQRLEQDAKEYKPIRDALAHTSLLTPVAKSRLTATFENIKAKIKNFLATP